MSNIDKRALREAVERAGQNDWEYVYTSDLSAPGRGYITVGGAEAIYCLNKAAGGVKQSENILRYIAAASPETMLALLDELEDYKASYEEESRDKEVQRSVIDDALCKLLPGCQYMDLPDGGSVTPLEQVSRMIADYLEQLQAAKKRIAELEAREVELPPLVDCSNVPFAAYSWNAYRAEAVKALRAAGITVKGDSE